MVVFTPTPTVLFLSIRQPHLGGYCSGVPPLPIPNREVKPACADGTAMQCGRVGGRLFSTREPRFCQEPGLPFSLMPQAHGAAWGRAKPAPCNLRSPPRTRTCQDSRPRGARRLPTAWRHKARPKNKET